MTVFKKSFLSLGIAAIGFSAVLIIFSMVFMNTLYYEINTESLKNTAKTLFSVIGENRVKQIFEAGLESQTIADLNVPQDALEAYRLTLIAPSGFVIWDSHAIDLVNHLDRQEIKTALQGNEAGARRHSISTGNELIYYALPVFDSGRVVGVFRLSVSVPGFGVRVSPVILPFVIYSCILAITAYWAIYAYSRSLADSVGRLVEIAQRSAPLLSGPEADELIAPEFRSLENAMRAMTSELTMRFRQAKAESAKLQAILNGMSEAVLAMDSNRNLHLANPSARILFHLNERQISNLESNKLSLLEATRSTELEELAKKALVSDTSLEMDITLRNYGAERYFQVYAAKLQASSTSNICDVVLVMQDVTRLVKLERVRKDFVANVSHELRTPIQLIKGFTETLLDTVKENTENKTKSGNKQIIHFIEIIQKNSITMENLTNDLLMLASLESDSISPAQRNGYEIAEEPVALLIFEAVSSLQLKAKIKNIEIISECSVDLKAKLYGSLIVQALINLIDNAIKYSPNDSKIRVTGSISEESDAVLLEVCDNGIGIQKDDQERIFERFYRVDKTQAHTRGTGLGLSIVKHIALLHNGSVEVESPPATAGAPAKKSGSVFRIIIPLLPRDPLPQ